MDRTGAKFHSLVLITMVLFITGFILNTYIPYAAADQDDSKSRVIVLLDEGVSKKDVKDFVSKKGGEIKADFNIINGMAVYLDNDKIEGLKAIKGVKKVRLDVEVYALDTELDRSWGVKRIGAGTVHNYGNTGAGIKVAVLDTGVDYNHTDLNDNFDNYVKGYDFVNNDNDPMDDHWHGTHVAGIIAAEDDGNGIVGVAPEACIYALKVLNASGSGYTSDIIEAIEWCCDNGIQVINMSLGSTSDDPDFNKAVSIAYNQGIVIVAAAGNSGKSNGKGDSIEYPARYEEVIAVAAVDSSDTRAYFSSTGPLLEIAAPGVSVLSCVSEIYGDYGYASGTSMASPHVAGTAALIMAANPGISNTALRQMLQDTADDLGEAGLDTKYGYGLVDADEAVLPVNGSISGTVSDGSSGIQGALVSCGDLTALTDAGGNYTISDVPPGTYTVTASAVGYESAAAYDVVVTTGQTTDIDFTLTAVAAANGSISGTVSDGSSGIPGALVSCGELTALTDAGANYTISDVPPGTYTVTASAVGYESAAAYDVVVTTGQTTDIDFTLTAVNSEQQVTVENILYSTSGGKNGTAHLIITIPVTYGSDAIANALVSVDVYQNGSLYFSGSGITVLDGTASFKLPVAPAGTYVTDILDIQAAGYVWDGETPENDYKKD